MKLKLRRAERPRSYYLGGFILSLLLVWLAGAAATSVTIRLFKDTSYPQDASLTLVALVLVMYFGVRGLRWVKELRSVFTTGQWESVKGDVLMLGIILLGSFPLTWLTYRVIGQPLTLLSRENIPYLVGWLMACLVWGWGVYRPFTRVKMGKARARRSGL